MLARALVSLRRDDLSAAQRLTEIVSQEAAGQFPGEPSVSAVAALIRARVLLADGDATAATAVLSRLRETWGPTCPALADVITVTEGEAALRVGNAGRARAVLLLVEEGEHFDRADAWLLRGGLLNADGDFKAALEAVAPGLDGEPDQVTLHERICGLLIAVVAHRRLGSADEAAALLEQALALAEPDGAYRAFLDGGAAVRSAMTVLIPPTSRHAGFAGRVLERFDAAGPPGRPRGGADQRAAHRQRARGPVLPAVAHDQRGDLPGPVPVDQHGEDAPAVGVPEAGGQLAPGGHRPGPPPGPAVIQGPAAPETTAAATVRWRPRCPEGLGSCGLAIRPPGRGRPGGPARPSGP